MTNYIDMHRLFAARPNLDLLEQNYDRWQKDPDSLDSGWSAFFEGFELVVSTEKMALPSKRRGKRGANCGRVRYKRESTPWFTLIAFSGTPSHG